jgi:hypothetical protein
MEMLRFGKWDWVLALSSLMVLILVIYFRFFVGLPGWMLWNLPF